MKTPKQFILYARETSTSTWVNLDSQSLTTALGNYVSGDVNTGGTRFNLSNPTTTAYQSFALVITHVFPAHLVHLNEFKLHCQPSEISEFKLYGSPDDVAWNEIHAQTSANINSSGTNFTIDTPGSYQYYGLVVTKNGAESEAPPEKKQKKDSDSDSDSDKDALVQVQRMALTALCRWK